LLYAFEGGPCFSLVTEGVGSAARPRRRPRARTLRPSRRARAASLSAGPAAAQNSDPAP
jgi:hypothetical protein